MALTGNIKAIINLTLTKAFDVDDGHSAQDALQINRNLTITDGAGLAAANLLFHDKRTIAAAANDDIDLAGSLADAFGDTITSARVKLIYVRNRSSTVSLNVGGSPANPFISWLIATGDGVVIRPTGWLMLNAFDATGYTLTGGASDVLRITHNNEASASADYDIVIAAASS